MKSASILYDKLIIFICCLFVYFFQAAFEVDIITILISLTISCFLSYFDNPKVKASLALVFFLTSFVIPQIIIFTPLIVFDIQIDNYKYITLIFLLPLIRVFSEGNTLESVIILVFIGLSILIRNLEKHITGMRIKHNLLIDSSRELSITLEKHNRELMDKQDSELNMAALNERNRIAREIHDSVGHLLTSSILQAGALKVINKDEKLEPAIDTLNDTLTNAMNSIRNSVHELYDDSIDLYESINKLVKEFDFCELNFKYNININPDKKLNYALIAIIKEALTNIVKHSNATLANIILSEHPALYQLIIRDNGDNGGYYADEGLGLKNMTSRVEAFNGNININNTKGFEIFITIPKESRV